MSMTFFLLLFRFHLMSHLIQLSKISKKRNCGLLQTFSLITATFGTTALYLKHGSILTMLINPPDVKATTTQLTFVKLARVLLNVEMLYKLKY